MAFCLPIFGGATGNTSPRTLPFLPAGLSIRGCAVAALLLALGAAVPAQSPSTPTPGLRDGAPPALRSARRFLAHRGAARARRLPTRPGARPNPASARPQSTSASANWEPLGPAAVLTPAYGLVSGRIVSLALDPSDSTGNTLYAGTTGGGVWVSHNAATSD